LASFHLSKYKALIKAARTKSMNEFRYFEPTAQRTANWRKGMEEIIYYRPARDIRISNQFVITRALHLAQ